MRTKPLIKKTNNRRRAFGAVLVWLWAGLNGAVFSQSAAIGAADDETTAVQGVASPDLARGDGDSPANSAGAGGVLGAGSTTASDLDSLRMSDEPLWLKAVVIAAANDDRLPGLWVEKEAVYDKKGKLEESKEYVVRLAQRADGEVEVRLIGAKVDGEAVEGNALEALAKAKAREILEDEDEDPFDSRLQRRVQVERTGQTRAIQGRTGIGFSYSQETKGGKWRGTAWLDAATGAPLEVHSAPETLPPEADGLALKSLRASTYYGLDETGGWNPGRVEVEMDIEVKFLPLVSFKGTAKTVVELREYWSHTLLR